MRFPSGWTGGEDEGDEEEEEEEEEDEGDEDEDDEEEDEEEEEDEDDEEEEDEDEEEEEEDDGEKEEEEEEKEDDKEGSPRRNHNSVKFPGTKTPGGHLAKVDAVLVPSASAHDTATVSDTKRRSQLPSVSCDVSESLAFQRMPVPLTPMVSCLWKVFGSGASAALLDSYTRQS